MSKEDILKDLTNIKKSYDSTKEERNNLLKQGEDILKDKGAVETALFALRAALEHATEAGLTQEDVFNKVSELGQLNSKKRKLEEEYHQISPKYMQKVNEVENLKKKIKKLQTSFWESKGLNVDFF